MARFLYGPDFQYTDNTGAMLSLGTVTVYAAGTTTLVDVYPTIADAIAKTNALTNPVTLDAYGRASIVLGVSSKILVKDSAGNTIHTEDNITDDATLLDNNGNVYLKANAAASAVNYVKIANAAAGNKPTIDTDGSDATPNLKIQAKGGTGTVEVVKPVLTGNTTLTGDLALTGNTTLVGTLGVTGNTTLTGDTSVTTTDSRTATTDRPHTVTSLTSGTPAANIGVGTLYRAESVDENPCEFGAIDFVATDVGAGSEDTDAQLHTRTAGAALKKAYGFRVTGVGDYLVTGAPTATRTVTFPDANINLTGTWEKISTATATSSSSISFTGLSSTYFIYKLLFHSMYAATDNTNILLTVSTDNGSTYVAGTSYYIGYSVSTSAGASPGGTDGGASFAVALGLSNVSTERYAGEITLYSIGTGSYAFITSLIGGIDANSRGRVNSASGEVVASSVNAIKIAMSSGNIAAGEFVLYGQRLV